MTAAALKTGNSRVSLVQSFACLIGSLGVTKAQHGCTRHPLRTKEGQWAGGTLEGRQLVSVVYAARLYNACVLPCELLSVALSLPQVAHKS